MPEPKDRRGPVGAARLAEITARAIHDDHALSCGQLDEWDVPGLKDTCFLLDQIDERDRRLHDVINALGHADARIAALMAERDELRRILDEYVDRQPSTPYATIERIARVLDHSPSPAEAD